MTEMVRYQDHVGLAAIVHALENVRLMLGRDDVTPAQAASCLERKLCLGHSLNLKREFPEP